MSLKIVLKCLPKVFEFFLKSTATSNIKYCLFKNNSAFYGGAIGFMDFEDNFNHAIIIRSFLSMNHELVFQAGAGIVSKSNPKSELQEINNKLGALNKALDLAEKI